ncbi:MAG: glycosyltransferase family 2 protein [Patescibacteria group bacterium]|nr:glycosyltransferase family 2 protein [Patescibacteria group bacterium]
MERPDISIIILNFNTKDLLKQCLESVIKSTVYSRQKTVDKIEIIVVDNASEDGSIEMIEKEFLEKEKKVQDDKKDKIRIKLIKNKENLGFAAGNNVGLKEAKGRYILFLNSDTIVFPQTLEKMVKYLDENPEVGLATCRVEFLDGTLDPASHRGFPTPWRSFTYFLGLEKLFPHSRLFSGYHLGHLNQNETHEIDTPTGAFYLVRKEILDKIGSFDERYFMYAEDIDLSLRIKKTGWKVMFVPIAKIIHIKKQSGRAKKVQGKITEAAKKIREKTISYFFDSMKTFYDTHYKNEYPWIVREVVLGGIWLFTQIKLLQNKLR